MRDYIFALCWVILFPAAFLSAHIGVILWIWVALSTPNLMLYNFLSSFPFNKAIAGITFMLVMFKPEKKDFYRDPLVVTYGLFVVLMFISNYFNSSTSYIGDHIFDKVYKEFALAIVITGVMYNRHRIHVVVQTFCISLAVVGAFEAAAYIVSGTSHKVLGSVSLGDNNGVAVAMLMSIPLCYYLYLYTADKYLRLGFGILIFCKVITVVATFSRGGFLGLIVLAIFMIMNARNKVLPIVMIAVLALMVVFFAPPDWFDRISTIQDADSSTSFLGRIVAWKVAFVASIDSPLIGHGPHGLQDFATWNRYVGQIGWISILDNGFRPAYAVAAHSIYFEVLGDLGFVGLGMFLLIIVMSIFYCGKTITLCKNQPEMLWAADLARFLRVSIIVYCCAGAALSYAYFEGFWIMIALISRLHHTVAQQNRKPTRAESEQVAMLAEEARVRSRQPEPA